MSLPVLGILGTPRSLFVQCRVELLAAAFLLDRFRAGLQVRGVRLRFGEPCFGLVEGRRVSLRRNDLNSRRIYPVRPRADDVRSTRFEVQVDLFCILPHERDQGVLSRLHREDRMPLAFQHRYAAAFAIEDSELGRLEEEPRSGENHGRLVLRSHERGNLCRVRRLCACRRREGQQEHGERENYGVRFHGTDPTMPSNHRALRSCFLLNLGRLLSS